MASRDDLQKAWNDALKNSGGTRHAGAEQATGTDILPG